MKKGQIIVNPATGRPIKVGSRTWNLLVKQGMFEEKIKDDNEITIIDETLPVEEQIITANIKLPLGQQAVRGRGKYSDKIVKRNKQLIPTEVVKYTSKIVSKIIDNSDDELEEIMEKMILQEMIKKKPLKINVKKESKSYKIQSEEEEADEDEDQYSEDE